VYPEDDVLLVPPDTEIAPEDFPLVATVEDLSNTRVELKIDWNEATQRRGVQRYLSRDRVGFGVLKLLNPLPFERRREAIETLRKDRQFKKVLTGHEALTFTNPRVARSDPHDPELNQEQQSAVKHALMADSLFCVHGPPGTGKTRTLVEVVRRAVDAGDRVLVCADSNQAVDNVLVGDSTRSEADPGSLHAYGQHGAGEFKITRRNVRRTDRELVREQYGDAPSGAEVVVATNGSAARIDGRFDLAVVDEATQATCATTAIPLSKADTAVLAGDHQQLPPFSRSEDPPESAYGHSLFEHLYADGGVFEDVGIQLRSQYRMHRDIAYFPNRRFYDRSLGTAVESEPLAEWPPIVGYDVGGTATRAGTSYRNEDEAALVAHLVDRLLGEEVSGSDIGVITPYAGQVQAIDHRLNERSQSGVDVDTIDSFQGSERTVILISLVRSNVEGRKGFLGRPADGPRRLNVAITRAQRLCVIVGDWGTLRTAPPREDHCTDLYEELYKHLTDTGRMREMDPELLPS
jgi:superfamily I DNA and/or RNA helicase